MMSAVTSNHAAGCGRGLNMLLRKYSSSLMLCVTSARAVCAAGTRGIFRHSLGYHRLQSSITVDTSCTRGDTPAPN